LEESVKLSGWVVRPGDYQWKPTMRLVDLLPSLAALRPEADAHYILIKRDNPPDRAVELSSANLVKALADPSGPANVVLKPRDELHIFSVHEDRATLVKPMLDRARATSSPAQPVREVWVEGAVHHPGRYPWSQAMTVDDLIDAAGGLTERAYLPAVELTRAAAIGAQTREPARQLIDITRSAVDGEARVVLQPSDRIVVRRIPQWEEDGVVELFGEVKFPGRYPIARGERLSQVIRRAGGLTDAAYPQAAVFLRQSVREREQQYLERLTAQLERDLGVLKTEGPEIGIKREAALLEGEALLRQMRAAKATGRMVVRLNEILRADADYDVTVQPGDKLVIPQRPDEITIIGEVYYPTSHVYIAGHTRDQYLQLSGGITERGNKRAVYVVRADGSVIPPSGWFGGDVAVGPGDTVIVPLKVDRISKLKLITDISTIIYQLAITAAALNVIGVL
jgi:polysaccharide biosynthesis/export protein